MSRSLSTLAHELGHSMHSYLTWKNQPLVYADYSLFVAEVASNFHQAMVRGHLLKTRKDAAFQIALIEEAMSNFFRYFFQMPTLARFELETHERIEKGESLTADTHDRTDGRSVQRGLRPEGQGRPATRRHGVVHFRPPLLRLLRLSVRHRHRGRKCALGRILRGEAHAAEDYLGFLKAGGSAYPLEVLKKAGVDLASPKPVEETFAVMEGYIDRLEKLVELTAERVPTARRRAKPHEIQDWGTLACLRTQIACPRCKQPISANVEQLFDVSVRSGRQAAPAGRRLQHGALSALRLRRPPGHARSSTTTPTRSCC